MFAPATNNQIALDLSRVATNIGITMDIAAGSTLAATATTWC